MAKLEKTLTGSFDALLEKIESGILNGSMTASLEDSSDFIDGDTRCSVRVFERYSVLGENRVSLNITLFQDSFGTIHLSAITAGGSKGMVLKINRIGEDAFLRMLNDVLDGMGL